MNENRNDANIELLCTLGPSSLNKRIIKRLDELGVSLFRLNLSHTKVEDAARIIRFVQRNTSVPLSLDTEGAQIRTGDLVEGTIRVRENSIIRARELRVPGNSRELNLYPPGITAEFVVGDFIHIDADVLVQVIEIEPDAVAMRVLRGGTISQNKAVTLERDISMSPLTEKDHKILAIGRELGIRHVALSFANRESDIDVIRHAAGPGAWVISKIECRAGLRNLEAIARASDAILIDRGDLSREVPIEQIPAAQKSIIRRAHDAGRKVYVATNLMESMTTLPAPTRAEVNDVFNTLVDGADGLVLAGETATGKFPIGCAGMLLKIIHQYKTSLRRPFTLDPLPSISLLVEPHGGRLVQRLASPGDSDDPKGLETILVDDSVLVDCEQVGVGAYSPLTGFMDRETLESTLESNRLPDGTIWTMPVLLPIGRESARKIGPGTRVAVANLQGRVIAIVDAREVFSVDVDALARSWFGNTTAEHPRVRRLRSVDGTFLAGDVTLVKRFSSPYQRYTLTPAQTRSVFVKKGWNRVVGFQTRNIPHRVHEIVQSSALEKSDADGLFIAAAIEPASPGEFLPEVVHSVFQAMFDFGRYPSERILFGSFPAQPRFPNPRDVVARALCLKNYGCSHVVVGPECGTGDERLPLDAVKALFENLGGIGVTPIFFDEIGYEQREEKYVDLDSTGAAPVRSAVMKQALRRSGELPPWFLSDLIQEVLRAEVAAGRPLFHGEAAR
ncbi:MAG TPA: pyruvate kinase [Vicinamibacteria bacterium]|nr:pyruvate kinase [Vicinamibacteria bacterium]